MRYFLAALVLVLMPVSAMAQETQPGDSCTGGQAHQMRQVAGPGNNGKGSMLVCDGATWNPVFRWNAETGQVLARIGEDSTACASGYEGSLRYSSSCLEFCDGSDWVPVCAGATGGGDTDPNSFSFTDVTDAGLNQWVESNIALIQGISAATEVMISGDGTPEYRICSDNTCSAVVQNWGSGLGSITNGQYLQVRLTSATTGETLRTADPIVVGGFSTSWNVTTTEVKLVFVTSLSYDGNLGSMNNIHAICAARATAAGLPGTYKAWIANSTASTAPASHFNMAGVPYIRTDGVTVASNWADLIDGSLQNPIASDEFGNAVGAGNVWTNVTAAGAQAGADPTGNDNCQSWATSWNGGNGRRGNSDASNGSWTASGTSTCNTTARLYCFQQ